MKNLYFFIKTNSVDKSVFYASKFFGEAIFPINFKRNNHRPKIKHF